MALYNHNIALPVVWPKHFPSSYHDKWRRKHANNLIPAPTEPRKFVSIPVCRERREEMNVINQKTGVVVKQMN